MKDDLRDYVYVAYYPCSFWKSVYQEAQLRLFWSNFFQDVKSELRLKIVPLRDSGTVGLLNGVISPQKHLKIRSYRCLCSEMDSGLPTLYRLQIKGRVSFITPDMRITASITGQCDVFMDLLAFRSLLNTFVN